jgi:hypothetical protein
MILDSSGNPYRRPPLPPLARGILHLEVVHLQIEIKFSRPSSDGQQVDIIRLRQLHHIRHLCSKGIIILRTLRQFMHTRNSNS